MIPRRSSLSSVLSMNSIAAVVGRRSAGKVLVLPHPARFGFDMRHLSRLEAYCNRSIKLLQDQSRQVLAQSCNVRYLPS